MKFLKFFNTRIDSEEFLAAIKAHWEWNVILVKCHWIKLLHPFLYTLLSLILLALILYLIYVNLADWNDTIYWWTVIFYLITTLSWTGYTVYWMIDVIRTQIGQKNKYITKTNSSFIKRKNRFELFLRWSTWVLLFHILFVIFNASVPFIVDLTWRWNLAVPIVVLILDILFLVNVSMIMYKVIDYEMNFWICSPDSFKLFRQTWILSSYVTDITPQSINIIKYYRKWLFQATFHYWDVHLYTDAEIRSEWGNVLELHYIPEPSSVVKKLNEILWKNQ